MQKAEPEGLPVGTQVVAGHAHTAFLPAPWRDQENYVAYQAVVTVEPHELTATIVVKELERRERRRLELPRLRGGVPPAVTIRIGEAATSISELTHGEAQAAIEQIDAQKATCAEENK
jgi:hypothetical protein